MEFGMAHSSRFQHNNTCILINPLDGGWTTILLLGQLVAAFSGKHRTKEPQGGKECTACVRKSCRLWGAHTNLSGPSRETWASPCFCSAGCRARVRVRTGILTMRFSSSAKAAECGRSTARPSKVPRETSLSSRLGRSTASRPLAIRRWYNLTFTSVPASSRRTCKSRRSRLFQRAFPIEATEKNSAVGDEPRPKPPTPESRRRASERQPLHVPVLVRGWREAPVAFHEDASTII